MYVKKRILSALNYTDYDKGDTFKFSVKPHTCLPLILLILF